jgi:tetratricopeptide (TPR) repeat protein
LIDSRTHDRDEPLDFLPHRGNLCGLENTVPHLSPTTLTTDEQRVILRATAGNLRDHTTVSLALGTGLRLAEVVGLNVGDVFAPDGTPRVRVRIRAAIAKGGRAADVFLPDGLVAKLKRFWRWKRERGESLDADAPRSGARPRFQAISPALLLPIRRIISDKHATPGGRWGGTMKTPTCFVLFVVVAAVASMGSAFSYQYYKGSERLQQGDFKGAVDALTKAIAKDPTNFGAFLNRGVAYDNLKQYDKALADFDSAIAIVPRFGRAFLNRGIVHDHMEQYEQAVADYDDALKNADNLVIDALGHTVEFDKAGVYYNRGNALYELKKFDESVASFTSAIALDGKFAAAYHNRGLVHFELGDKAAGCADRSKACELGFAASCKWTKDNC